MNTHHHSSLRVFLAKELPSLHAGLLVVGAILATMLNVGFFAVLLAAIITLDIAAARGRTDSWQEALREAMRDVLLDGTLFVIALTVALYFRLPPPFVDRRGLRLMLWSLSVGSAIAVPKIILLYRLVSRVAHPFSRVVATAGRPLDAGEISFLFVLTVSLLLLLLSPFILAGGMRDIISFLQVQVAFWRM